MAALYSSRIIAEPLPVDGYLSLDGEKLVSVRLYIDPDSFAVCCELPPELRPPKAKIQRKPAQHATTRIHY